MDGDKVEIFVKIGELVEKLDDSHLQKFKKIQKLEKKIDGYYFDSYSKVMEVVMNLEKIVGINIDMLLANVDKFKRSIGRPGRFERRDGHGWRWQEVAAS